MQHKILSILLIGLLLSCSKEHIQDPNLLHSLISSIESENDSLIEKNWEMLKNGNQPFIWDDSVAFIYRGNANTVQWNGDFNGWSKDRSFKNQGVKISNSDFWLLKTKFPSDARFDYKIVVDRNWILDPNNENTQMTGVGGGSLNSEIRMPDSQPSEWITTIPEQNGTLSEWITISSEKLGYDINYKVYTPFGYDNLSDLPTIYTTDGHEYSHSEMGSMTRILNNLIAQNKITPAIAVFIDPREPGNLQNNRRMEELVLNPLYKDFISNELIPKIDETYKTSATRNDRLIMGTSLGGLNASYLGTLASDMFGNVLIQSPAYWYRPEIYDIVISSSQWPVKVSLSTGTFHDTQKESLIMRDIYNSNSTLQYIEVNEGHSWGNWRTTLGDQLIHIFGK